MNAISAALMVIDAQTDFLLSGGAYSCWNAAETVRRIAEALQIARQAGLPVIFTREAHAADGSDYGMEAVIGEPPHCVEDTPGIEIIPALYPREGEWVVNKRRYSAFLGTNLEDILNRLGRPVIFITGFCTNACVQYTAIDAFQYDYDVHVIREAVSGTSKEHHQTGLAALSAISNSLVVTMDAFLSAASLGSQ